VITGTGTMLCYSWLVIYKLSDPMVHSHWILFDRLLHSMYNWWTGCLIIYVRNYVYRFVYNCPSLFGASFALAWWVILISLLKWLDKCISVPVCFITYGRTNTVYRQWDSRVVLKRLLKMKDYFDSILFLSLDWSLDWTRNVPLTTVRNLAGFAQQ
jgi:hypothetical protein